jgi:hypothetical protein
MATEAREVRLRTIAAAAADRYAASARARDRGDVSLQVNAADLAAKLDAEAQAAQARHDADKARLDLNGVLGLQASVRLPLAPGRAFATYSPEEVRSAEASLPTRRPDLLALQAGYRAQDAHLRKAVIAQFPLVSLAYNYAKDPAGTTTRGVAAVVGAPITGNRFAEAKVQGATREQLRAEYQARLDQTSGEVAAAVTEVASATAQAEAIRAEAPRLEALAAPAAAALRRGDLDSAAYLGLAQNIIAKRADLDDRDLARRLAEIQLETALFLPPATSRAAP